MLQAGARRYQLVCALGVLPVLLARYSPGHRRSTPSESLELRVLPRQDASHPGGGGGVVNVVDVTAPTWFTDVSRHPPMQEHFSLMDYRSF